MSKVGSLMKEQGIYGMKKEQGDGPDEKFRRYNGC